MALEWFLTKYRKKLLSVFFDNPNTKFNLHQLAYRANLDPGNATRYVQECVLLGLLKKEKRKNEYLISPNYVQPHIRKIFELFEVDRTWRFLTANEDLQQPIIFLKDILAGLDSLKLLSLRSFHGDNGGLLERSMHLLIVKSTSQSTLLVKQTVDDICAEYEVCKRFDVDIIDDLAFENSIQANPEFYSSFWGDRVVINGEDYLWQVIPELGVKLTAKPINVAGNLQVGELA